MLSSVVGAENQGPRVVLTTQKGESDAEAHNNSMEERRSSMESGLCKFVCSPLLFLKYARRGRLSRLRYPSRGYLPGCLPHFGCTAQPLFAAISQKMKVLSLIWACPVEHLYRYKVDFTGLVKLDDRLRMANVHMCPFFSVDLTPTPTRPAVGARYREDSPKPSSKSRFRKP